MTEVLPMKDISMKHEVFMSHCHIWRCLGLFTKDMKFLELPTCTEIVWQFTADVTAAPARGVRGAHRLEVGWPQLRGRGEHAPLTLCVIIW